MRRTPGSRGTLIAAGLVCAGVLVDSGAQPYQLMPLASFRAPCQAVEGLGLTSDGLALLCRDCDSLILVDKLSGAHLSARALGDTAIWYISADTAGQLYGWRRTDTHIYRLNTATGALSVLDDTLTSSRVFTCDGGNVVLYRNEGTWSEVMVSVSLSDGSETWIDYGTGDRAGIFQDRYFWHMNGSAGGANIWLAAYDLQQPPDLGWMWQPILHADYMVVPFRGCWGLAKSNDTMWTYSRSDSLVHLLRTPDSLLAQGIGVPRATRPAARPKASGPGALCDLRGRMPASRGAGRQVLCSVGGRGHRCRLQMPLAKP